MLRRMTLRRRRRAVHDVEQRLRALAGQHDIPQRRFAPMPPCRDDIQPGRVRGIVHTVTTITMAPLPSARRRPRCLQQSRAWLQVSDRRAHLWSQTEFSADARDDVR